MILMCVGYGQPNVSTITWAFNGEPVVNSSLVSILPEVDFVIRGRQYRQSRLQLCSVGTDSIGSYTCTVSNGDISASALAQLTLVGNDLPKSSECVSLDHS